jgi:probable rRNA maturation factor
MTCSVEVTNHTAEDVDLEALAQLVATIVEDGGPGDAEAGVLLVGAAEMQELNRLHRDIDEVTDVLAFPIDADEELPEAMQRLLGDVVVCLDRAAEQASEAGHAPGRELAILTVHGTLHLLGHDHEEDAGEMLALQDRLCAEIADVGWRR